MKFCPNCGNKFNETDKFCSGCGTSRNFGNLMANESTQLTAQPQNKSVELTSINQTIVTDTQEVLLEASMFVNGELKYGLVNLQGNWIIQPMFDSLKSFDKKDYCIAELNNQQGFINRQGQWVIQPIYDSIGGFDDKDFCRVAINEKEGFINRKGNWVIQPIYDRIWSFDEKDFCIVETNGKYGFINRQGDWMIQPIFDSIGTFDDKDFCSATINGKSGFINRQGNWIIQPIFDSIGTFDDKDYCDAKLNDKSGFVNRQGNWIIQPTFDSVGNFDSKDFCMASLNEKMGFIDRNGRWIINPVYDIKYIWGLFPVLAGFTNNDLCEAYLNDKCGLINRQGNWVVHPNFEEIRQFNEFDTYCVKQNTNEGYNYGLINHLGHVIINPIFWEWIEFMPNQNFGIVNQEGKFGLINKLGQLLIQPNYWILKQTNYPTIFKASLNNKYGFIDSNGSWLVAPKFDYNQKDFEDNDMVWNEKTNEWESKKISFQYDFNKYFESVDSRVYISENIPPKKLNAFVNRIKREFQDENDIGNEFPKVYCDDTIFGKGDDGFLITMDEEDDEDLRLFLAPSSGYIARFYFSQIDKIEVIKNNLIITSNNENDTFSFTFIGKEKAIQQVKSFFEEYFYIEMEDNEDDNYEEDDNDPLGLRDKSKSKNDSDPLGLRN
jgi:SH3-like domain-containing protein